MWLCRTQFEAKTGTKDMIQGNRVLWLCRAYFEAGIGTRDIIQGNRVMWLCKVCVKGRIRMGSCAKHVSRLGRAPET